MALVEGQFSAVVQLLAGIGQTRHRADQRVSRPMVTKNGYFVTHDFHRDNVAVTRARALTSKLPKVGSLDWSITTGKQGEVTASTLTVSSRHSFTTVNVTVLSYNRPAHIVAPPSAKVKVEAPTFLEGCLVRVCSPSYSREYLEPRKYESQLTLDGSSPRAAMAGVTRATGLRRSLRRLAEPSGRGPTLVRAGPSGTAAASVVGPQAPPPE